MYKQRKKSKLVDQEHEDKIVLSKEILEMYERAKYYIRKLYNNLMYYIYKKFHPKFFGKKIQKIILKN